MPVERLFMNLVVDLPTEAARFYEHVFGLKRSFESDWFVHLGRENGSGVELGFLKRTHEVTPPELNHPETPPQVLLTIVVENADEAHDRAIAQGGQSIQKPRDLFYGQRRAIVQAPDGTLLDISSPCTPDPNWMKRVSQNEGGGFVESSD